MLQRSKEDDVHQNYEVRQLIEPYVIAVAARRISTVPDLRERLSELQQKARSIKEAATSGPLTPSQRETYRGIDLELYKIVLDALDHDLLKRVFSLISDHSLRIRLFAEATVEPSRGEVLHNINGEHLAIIEALLGRDAEKAQETVQNHLKNAEARTAQAIRNRSDEKINKAPYQEGVAAIILHSLVCRRCWRAVYKVLIVYRGINKEEKEWIS